MHLKVLRELAICEASLCHLWKVMQIREVPEDCKKAYVTPVFRKEDLGQSDSPQSLGWSKGSHVQAHKC